MKRLLVRINSLRFDNPLNEFCTTPKQKKEGKSSGGSRIFPRRGANSKGGCEKLLFGNFFPKNCMKLKEFGTRGGGVPGAPS